MRIAWRYKALPKVDAEKSISVIGFDLTKPIDSESLKSLNIEFFNDLQVNELNENFNTSVFGRLLEALKKSLNNFDEKSNSCEENLTQNCLRICINEFGSPLWYSDTYKKDICKFLIMVKSLVRNSRSVCCITIPTHLLQHCVSIKPC